MNPEIESTTPAPRVLIVEDELIVSADLSARLARMGFDVLGQTDCAEQAVSLCVENRPDLVLMDIRLNGEMDGIAGAQEIHRQCGDIPIVFLTAHADESTFQRSKLQEPFGYVLKPFEERELRIALGIALDRAQLDRKLRQSQQFLSTILNCIHEAVIVLDPENHEIQFVNGSAERLLGHEASQLVSTPLDRFLEFYEKGGSEQVSIAELIEHKQTDFHELVIRSNNTREHTVVVNSSQLSKTQPSSSTVFVLRDVTHQRQLETKLMQSQRMESLGHMASGIAHDLNNLLTVVSINSSLLEELPGFNQIQQELLRNILLATDRAARITQQLLAIGKKQIAQPTKIDLNATIQSYQKLISSLAGSSIDLSYQLCEQCLTIFADPIQIQQILLNLVRGGRRSETSTGSITIRTSRRDLCIELGQRDGAVLEIEDARILFDAQSQAEIWEPFFGDNRSGTGLDLAVVYGIAKQLNGEVSCSSGTNSSLVYRVFLPLCD